MLGREGGRERDREKEGGKEGRKERRRKEEGEKKRREKCDYTLSPPRTSSQLSSANSL